MTVTLRRRLWTAATVLWGAVVIGLFFALHTGERADELCEDQVFVRGGEFSLFPPGAQCSFGEPQQTSVVLHPAVWLLILGFALVAVVAWWNRRATASE